MALCLAAWADAGAKAFRLGYMLEAITFGREGPERIVADVFVKNASGARGKLHFVHRRAVVPEVLTGQWLNACSPQTALFTSLFEGGLTVDAKNGRLTRERTGQQSRCVDDLLSAMPSEVRILTDATITVDPPLRREQWEEHIPYTSFALGDFPPGEDWFAVRFGFDVTQQMRLDLVLTDQRTRRWGVEGPRVLLDDIQQLDLAAVPDGLRASFAAYEERLREIREKRVQSGIYDVVLEKCNPNTQVIRFDTHAQRLCVGETLRETVRWWRAEADDFVIQIIEPL